MTIKFIRAIVIDTTTVFDVVGFMCVLVAAGY